MGFRGGAARFFSKFQKYPELSFKLIRCLKKIKNFEDATNYFYFLPVKNGLCSFFEMKKMNSNDFLTIHLIDSLEGVFDARKK